MSAASKSVQEHFDIIIVGGGIVGQSLALLLARQAASPPGIALIDAQPATAGSASAAVPADVGSFSPRVSALSAASVELFSELGIWEALQDDACAYQDMYVWDAEGTGHIQFAAADVHAEALGYIAENQRISTALAAALEATAVTVIKGDAVAHLASGPSGTEAAYRELQLQSGRSLRCRLLVGADGARSFVREHSGFQCRTWDYQQQAIVATVATEKAHAFTAAQCFHDRGVLAFLPLKAKRAAPAGQHFSSIVWSCEPALAAELMALPADDFAGRLARTFEYRLGAVTDVGPRLDFPLWQRHASAYVQEGVALVGDAAHTIHPLAGQGANLGILDAKALAECVQAAIQRGADYGSEQVLSAYQRQRKGHNLAMMLLMEGFKRGFGSDQLGLRWLRNAGLSAVDAQLPLKRQLIMKAMGL